MRVTIKSFINLSPYTDKSPFSYVSALLIALHDAVAIDWLYSVDGPSKNDGENQKPLFLVPLGILTNSLPFFMILNLQVAVLLPSLVVTVIVAFPSLIALTFPFWSTVATSSLSDIQVTFLLVAFSG